jgi:hypothetical protein
MASTENYDWLPPAGEEAAEDAAQKLQNNFVLISTSAEIWNCAQCARSQMSSAVLVDHCRKVYVR